MLRSNEHALAVMNLNVTTSLVKTVHPIRLSLSNHQVWTLKVEHMPYRMNYQTYTSVSKLVFCCPFALETNIFLDASN